MEEKRKSFPWHWWTVAVVVLLVTYPLSSGPVLSMLLQHGGYDSPSFKIAGHVYQPLIWIVEAEVWPLSGWLVSYWQWWVLID